MRDERSQRRSRMRRLSARYGVWGIMVAASGAADYTLITFSFVALVHCPTKTTCVYRRSRDRERQWEEGSHQREQQQKSGGQTLHDCCANPESRMEASIEHIPEYVQDRRCRGIS